MRLRTLKCSFCGKTDAEVGRLIAGPKVHICDACVGVCNRILEASPDVPKGWDAMSDQELLSALTPASAAVDGASAVLHGLVDAARRREVSWERIGGALGVSRQAAWERFR